MTPAYPIGARVICEATPHSREMEAVVVAVDGDRRKVAFPDHALCGSRDVSALRPHPECRPDTNLESEDIGIVDDLVRFFEYLDLDALDIQDTTSIEGALASLGSATYETYGDVATALRRVLDRAMGVTP